MKLSIKAIELITVKAKNRIALAMDCSAHTVDRWIRDNAENGDLTKAVPLKILREETGLGTSQILERSNVIA